MNDPKAVELMALARKAQACSTRLAPYEEKEAAGTLQMADLSKEDAVWLLGVVKPAAHRALLREIAKGHPALSLIRD